LNKVPLPQPRISFIGQQTVSKDPAVGLQSFALDEIPVVSYQNLLDKVGVVEEIDMPVKSTVVEDVAILPRPLCI
jgi:hypothetical protein